MRSATFFGRRSADIEEMITALDARQLDGTTGAPAPGTGTLRAVADDSQHFNLEDGVEGADTERVDLDVMEHTRQNRLRSWQTPADTARRRF